jgi:Holliday junction resolvase
MAKKSDGNQAEIVKGLRQLGASVTVLSAVGFGCPDLICGYHEKNYLFECKNLTGRGDRLTPAEADWIKNWKGQIAIIFNVEQALAVLQDGDYADEVGQS